MLIADCQGQVHVSPSKRHPRKRPARLYISAGVLVPGRYGRADLSSRFPGHGEQLNEIVPGSLYGFNVHVYWMCCSHVRTG